MTHEVDVTYSDEAYSFAVRKSRPFRNLILSLRWCVCYILSNRETVTFKAGMHSR